MDNPLLKDKDSTLLFNVVPIVKAIHFLLREKGDCYFEWFRVKGDGAKEKLNAGGMFDSIVFFILFFDVSVLLSSWTY